MEEKKRSKFVEDLDETPLIDLSHQESSASSSTTSTSNSPDGVIDLTNDVSVIDLTTQGSIKHDPSRKRTRNTSDHDPLCIIAAKKPATSVLDCTICLEAVERFRGYSLSNCGHTFCRPCLHGYVQSKLSDKAVRLLTCPNTKCRKQLCTADIRACTLELGDTSSWRSFQELATEAFLDTAVASNDTTLRRCPTDRCNFTFQFEPAGRGHQGQLFICPECDQAYCLNCPVLQGQSVGPAHDDTCAAVLEQVRQSQEQKRKLEEWKRDNAQADARFQELLRIEGASGRTKPCPKCRTSITKNGGCNHMHCSQCGTDFNWTDA